MSPTPIQVGMVTCAGRFRDNRRGLLRVHAQGPGLAELTIDQPPQFGTPGTRTTIVLGEASIAEAVAQLRGLADALEEVADLDAWRQYQHPEPAEHKPWWWQQYPVAEEVGA